MEVLKEHQYVITAIKNVAEEQGIKNFKMTEVVTNEKGNGFNGLFFLVKVKDTTSDKELDLAIKVAFTDNKIRKMVPIKMSYENEINFYSKVYPELKLFEKHHGITQSEFVPKCFKVYIEDTREMLFLENLKILGFELFDVKSALDLDHISLLFKTYGQFHAYSLALKQQKPETYNEVTKNFNNMYATFCEGEDTFFKVVLMNCGKLAIEHLKSEDDIIKSKLEELYGDKCFEIFKELTTETCPYSVILHGDCWSNNMLFKYDKKTNANKRKLVDLRLLDWQVTKIGNPVCDLSYCFYAGASEEVIDNLDHCLRIYHDSLSSCLSKFGCDAEKLYPFDALKEDWKTFAKFGVMMGMMIWKFKMSNTEEVVEFTDGMDSVDDFGNGLCNASFNEEGYTNIIRKIFHHMCEIGAL